MNTEQEHEVVAVKALLSTAAAGAQASRRPNAEATYDRAHALIDQLVDCIADLRAKVAELEQMLIARCEISDELGQRMFDAQAPQECQVKKVRERVIEECATRIDEIEGYEGSIMGNELRSLADLEPPNESRVVDNTTPAKPFQGLGAYPDLSGFKGDNGGPG